MLRVSNLAEAHMASVDTCIVSGPCKAVVKQNPLVLILALITITAAPLPSMHKAPQAKLLA